MRIDYYNGTFHRTFNSWEQALHFLCVTHTVGNWQSVHVIPSVLGTVQIHVS